LPPMERHVASHAWCVDSEWQRRCKNIISLIARTSRDLPGGEGGARVRRTALCGARVVGDPRKVTCGGGGMPRGAIIKCGAACLLHFSSGPLGGCDARA
jgi:hypothetical protein